MQTTCPECRTTFRVSQEHLGARRGLVRCGSCHAVFNAYDTLLPELETPSPHEVAHAAPASATYKEPPALIQSTDALESAAVEVSHVEIEGPLDAAEIAPAESGAVEAEAAADEAGAIESAPALETLTQAAADPEPATATGKAVPDILLEPMWPVSDKPKRTWKFWLYLLLAGLLAAMLVLQTLYFLRGELAAALPATRPALESLCRPLACTVPLARQLDKSSIAASSLEHDPENKSRVKLSLLLANRSGQAQAWPWIKLTLSDVRQAPVAQKVFRPSAYLPKDLDAGAGLAAGSEREIRLDLDIGNLVASGYAVNLYYP